MVKKADHILGFFIIGDLEPEQDVYYSQDVPFFTETILDGSAIYCIHTIPAGGATIVGKDGSFLLTGHTRKGKKYLLDKWLAGERTDESYLTFY